MVLGEKRIKIKKVKIENSRSIKCIEFDFKDLTILIGENNTGKTNILNALNLFFSSSVKGINEEFFYNKDTSNDISITVTFDRLSANELETKINKYTIDGTLTVKKTFSYDVETGKIVSKFFGLIKEPKETFLKLSKFDEYKDRLPKVVEEHNLPNYFKTERATITQSSYKEGLKKYIQEKANEIEWDAPYFSKTHFLGWKEVAESYLPYFFYVPAVKEASEETTYTSSNLFGRLLDAMLLKIPGEIPEFSKLKGILDTARNILNRPPKGEKDKRPSRIKDMEKSLLSILQESMPSTADVKIQVNVPDIRDIFRAGSRLIINDGIETTVESKGHGLQRAVIFALFRLYANILRETGSQQRPSSKPFTFVIEEPELYLHPQSQRVMFQVLESLSETEQIIFCTHSPFFIDMSRYDSLIIVSKADIYSGSQVFQVVEDIFDVNDKGYFRMLNEFDPERSEIFFAKKVVLVEGDCEKVAFPRIAKKMNKDLNVRGISIIECGGKFNIGFFVKVLNAFKIPYVVVHDVDPVDDSLTGDRLRDARKLFEVNNTIQSILNASLGKIEPIDPDFEHVLGITRHQAEKLGKPYAAFRKLETMQESDILPRLKEIVDSFF